MPPAKLLLIVLFNSGFIYRWKGANKPLLFILHSHSIIIMKFISFIPAILLFILCTTLLVMPGNQLPQSSFFNIPYFDKYVHFGMFAVLAIAFSIPFIKANLDFQLKTSWLFSIMLYLLVYGIAIEFIQKYFIPFRSFDVVDVLFDGLGAATGYIAIWLFLRKKIGPDGNRGRNQN
jgi:VanZ family protein